MTIGSDAPLTLLKLYVPAMLALAGALVSSLPQATTSAATNRLISFCICLPENAERAGQVHIPHHRAAGDHDSTSALRSSGARRDSFAVRSRRRRARHPGTTSPGRAIAAGQRVRTIRWPMDIAPRVHIS